MRIVWKDSISRAKKGSANNTKQKKPAPKMNTKKEEAVSS